MIAAGVDKHEKTNEEKTTRREKEEKYIRSQSNIYSKPCMHFCFEKKKLERIVSIK